MASAFSARFKGVIFDMDNTLLRSCIDFSRLKTEVFKLYQSRGILPETMLLEDHTVATLIEEARRTAQWTGELEKMTWRLVAEYEREGLKDAQLENGVREVLKSLHGRMILAVVTNNSRLSALNALWANRVVSFFQDIVGREQMDALKPSPSGIHCILTAYPRISPEHWLCVGDSWMDGMAARDSGVPFLAYRADRETMRQKGIQPIGFIERMEQLLEVVNGA